MGAIEVGGVGDEAGSGAGLGLFSPGHVPRAIHAVSRSSSVAGTVATSWNNGRSNKAAALGKNMLKTIDGI